MTLILRALYRQTVRSGKRTVYVSASSGSDSNNGLTTSTAYATIQAAINAAQAGDRILVAAGTYGYLSVYQKTGTPQNWISIESLNDSVRPIISVADNSGNDGIDIQLSSNIGIFGFEVVGLQTSTNTNPSGIGIFRASTYIFIWNNLVHDFPGGGVNCFYVASSTSGGTTYPAGSWDLVDISFNTIHDTSKYSPYNTSGISFYGAIDSTSTTLDGRYGYRAVGNYIYNVICTVPYTPGGINYVTDGNGISCDSLNTANNLAPGIPSYTKFGLVEGNIITGCGGRAVHTYNTINVDDFFGTYIGNLRTNSQAINNGVETDAQYDTAPTGGNGVSHVGCVIMPLNTPNTTDGVSTYTNCVITGGTQAVPAANTNRISTGVAYLAGSPSMTTAIIAQPMSFFTPTTPITVPRALHTKGYQALGTGARPLNTNGSTIPAPQVVRTATYTAPGTVASVPLSLASAPAAGNLLVAIVGFKAGIRSIATPSGWTAIDYLDTNSNNDALATYYKIATVADTSVTFTISSTGANDYASGILYEISGASTSSPINQHGIATTSSSLTSFTTPSETPSVLNTLVLATLATDTSGSGLAIASTGWTLDAHPSPGYHGTASAHLTTATTDTVTSQSATFTISSGSMATYSTTIIAPGSAVSSVNWAAGTLELPLSPVFLRAH